MMLMVMVMMLYFYTRVRNDNRVSVFRRWLLRTFGEEFLRSGSGVLDVAGGKGELAFELLNLHRVPSTVVDPRRLDLARFSSKLVAGFYHRTLRGFNSAECQSPPASLRDVCVPRHIRCMFEGDLGIPISATITSPAAVTAAPAAASDIQYRPAVPSACLPKFAASVESFRAAAAVGERMLFNHKGLTLHNGDDDDGDDGDNCDIKEEDEEGETVESLAATLASSLVSLAAESEGSGGDDDIEWRVARACVCDCSMIVGMHPDQVLLLLYCRTHTHAHV